MTNIFPTFRDLLFAFEGNDTCSPKAAHLLDYFHLCLPNPRTRAGYQRTALQFCQWAKARGLTSVRAVQPADIAAFITERRAHVTDTTAASELTALRGWFQHLATEGHLPFSPAASVKGPSGTRTENKAIGLTDKEVAALFNSIETNTLKGLRDRAMIGLMLYTGCRVGAVCAMQVQDFYGEAGHFYVSLHDKEGRNGEGRTVAISHKAAGYLSTWLDAAGIASEPETPLFRSMPIHLRNKPCQLTENPTLIQDAWFMVKARCQKAGLGRGFTNQSFRVTAISKLLESGATLGEVQQIAGHVDARTAAFYDRRSQMATADLMERINYEKPAQRLRKREPA